MFADNLLTPMSSKMSMSFFLQSKRNEGFSLKHSRIFLHIMDFNGVQMVKVQMRVSVQLQRALNDTRHGHLDDMGVSKFSAKV